MIDIHSDETDDEEWTEKFHYVLADIKVAKNTGPPSRYLVFSMLLIPTLIIQTVLTQMIV